MKTISIMSVVNVLEALANDNLDDSVFLMDNNVSNGSIQQGTPILKTKVEKGDRIVWLVMPLEVDSYVGISDIQIDKSICTPEKMVFPNTNVVYWIATILEKPLEDTSYTINFQVASRNGSLTAKEKPSLIG